MSEQNLRSLKLRKKEEEEEQKSPSFWDRIGRLPGALATGVRIGSGALASPGGAWGSTIAAGGEGFAQLIEKPESLYGAIAAVPDVVRNSFSDDQDIRQASKKGFREGMKAPIARMAVEGAIGVVPGARLAKSGKFLESALRSGALAGSGTIGRQIASGEDVDLKTAGQVAVGGGVLGGLLGKLSTPTKRFTNKDEYQKNVQAPWKAQGLAEPPPPSSNVHKPIPMGTHDEMEQLERLFKTGADRADTRFKALDKRKVDEGTRMWQDVEDELAAAKRAAEEADKLAAIRAQREADGYTDETRSYGGSLVGEAPDGSRETMGFRYTNPEEEARKAAEKAAKKTGSTGNSVPDNDPNMGGQVPPKGPSTPPVDSGPSVKGPWGPSGFDNAKPVGRGVAEDVNKPQTLAGLLGAENPPVRLSNEEFYGNHFDNLKAMDEEAAAARGLNVSDDVAEDIASGAIDVRPIPKPVPNVSDRRMQELLKMFGGRRSTDPPELRTKPRTDIDSPMDAEIGPSNATKWVGGVPEKINRPPGVAPKVRKPRAPKVSQLDEIVDENSAQDQFRQTTHPSFFDDGFDALEDAVPVQRGPKGPVAPPPAAAPLESEPSPLNALMNFFRSRSEASGDHYNKIKYAATTDPKLKEPLPLMDSKGKPYTSERIAGKNARQDAKAAAVIPTPMGPVEGLKSANDLTAEGIERKLAARRAEGMATMDETADQVQERILREHIENSGKPPIASVPVDDPIRNLGKESASLTPAEIKTLRKFKVSDEDIDKAPISELKAFLSRARTAEFEAAQAAQTGTGPAVQGLVESTPKPKLKKKGGLPDLFEGISDDAPSAPAVAPKDAVIPGAPGMAGKLPEEPLGRARAKSLGIDPNAGVPGAPEAPALSALGHRMDPPGPVIKPRLRKKVQSEGVPDDPAPLDPKGEKGAIDVGLLSKMLLGGGGALTGAVMNPDDPFTGALAGGAAGLGLSVAPQILRSMGVNSNMLDNLPDSVNREGLRETASKIAKELPHIQRANYLASAPGLAANAGVGPYMSGVTGAIEAGLKGDPRGWAALKLLINPKEVYQNIGPAHREAKTLVETAERRTLGEAPTAFDTALSYPGTILTTGDVTVRNILKKAGFNEDEAKLFTMTNEPSSQAGRAMVNAQRTGGPWINLALPFVRTPMNMLEQGSQRLPAVGGLYKLLKGGMNDTLDSQALRDIGAEQLLSAGTGGAAYLAGANMDEDTARFARRFVSNAGGRNAFTSNIGFALGQESRRPNGNQGNALARAVGSGFAFPQTDALEDQIKMGASILDGEVPELPGGTYPKFVEELFGSSPSSSTLTDVPSNVPSLRNIRLRPRGQ